jgi:hypothetical protein
MIAVAMRKVKPKPRLRPRAPGQSVSDSHSRFAGRVFSFAVASDELKPRSTMRPRAPGQPVRDAHAKPAGRTPINQSVAKRAVKPTGEMRPRAPGHERRDARLTRAGRVFPLAVAIDHVKPNQRMRPPRPASAGLIPTQIVPGAPFPTEK